MLLRKRGPVRRVCATPAFGRGVVSSLAVCVPWHLPGCRMTTRRGCDNGSASPCAPSFASSSDPPPGDSPCSTPCSACHGAASCAAADPLRPACTTRRERTSMSVRNGCSSRAVSALLLVRDGYRPTRAPTRPAGRRCRRPSRSHPLSAASHGGSISMAAVTRRACRRRWRRSATTQQPSIYERSVAAGNANGNWSPPATATFFQLHDDADERGRSHHPRAPRTTSRDLRQC